MKGKRILKLNFIWNTPLGNLTMQAFTTDYGCWDRIPSVLDYSLNNALIFYEPKTLSDIEDIKSLLLTFSGAIDTYIDNLMMGVSKGMVQNTEAWVAGINALERVYLQVSLHNETGRSMEFLRCSFTKLILE